METIKE